MWRPASFVTALHPGEPTDTRHRENVSASKPNLPRRVTFNQFVRNKMLRGRICGIFGFGGIGTATARLMRCVGMRIHAINRLGATDEKVDWIGTPDRRDELLAAADVLIINTPLTRATQG